MRAYEHLFTAQWKIDAKHGSKLINRNFLHWPFESTEPYVLPNEGTEGYIEHPDGMVLGILSNTTVVLEEKSSPISDEQKWLRGSMDANDWFTLTNPKSGKVLTAPSLTTLSVESKPHFLKNIFPNPKSILYFVAS